ncbi:MAG: VOC family protein [Anaerolineales bacterium]
MHKRPGIEDQITFLYTDDLNQAGDFYGEVLGLELVLDQGMCRIFRTRKGAYLGICQKREKQGVGREVGVIFTLVVEDVDSWYRYLETQAEVALQGEPKVNEEYGIYHFFLQDTDGYTLEIQRFLDPDWDELMKGN